MDKLTELAWAAGFFDGEGYCAFAWRKSGQAYTKWYGRLDVMITQNDRRVLDRFKNAVGVGRVKGPYQPPGTKNPRWYYYATGFPKFTHVMDALWPFLDEIKRAQFTTALNCYSDYQKRTDKGLVEKPTAANA